jgi:excisionase family DNA binding protein
MTYSHVTKPIYDRDLMSLRRRRAYDFLRSAVNFAPSDELLDITQVATRLGIPKSTVYELTRHRASVRHDHPLPCFKVGRRLKFNWTAVLAWLTELEKAGIR